MKEEKLWTLISTGVAIASGIAARSSARKAYAQKSSVSDDSHAKWRQALLWGATTSVLAGVASVVGRRTGSETIRRAKRYRQARKAMERSAPEDQ